MNKPEHNTMKALIDSGSNMPRKEQNAFYSEVIARTVLGVWEELYELVEAVAELKEVLKANHDCEETRGSGRY